MWAALRSVMGGAGNGPCSGALLTVAGLLMEASRDTPDLVTCMESSIDFQTHVDEAAFKRLMEAMREVQSHAKNSKSKSNKEYIVRVNLPEEAAVTSVSVKASSEDLVWRLKQFAIEKIRIKNKSFPEGQHLWHLENFNGDKINETLTLRDIKGKERGVREVNLVKGWEGTRLQKELGAANPTLVAACFKYYLRLMPEPLVPHSQYQEFLEAFKSTRGNSSAARASALAVELRKLPPANFTSMRAVCELISVNPDESWQKAYTFGPIFLRAKDKGQTSLEESAKAVTDVKVVFELVQFLVTSFSEVNGELGVQPLLVGQFVKQSKKAATPKGAASSTPAGKPPLPATAPPPQECPKCGKTYAAVGFCEACGTRLVTKGTGATKDPKKDATPAKATTPAPAAAAAQDAAAKKKEEERLAKAKAEEERVKAEREKQKKEAEARQKKEQEEAKKREEERKKEEEERRALAQLMKEDDERKRKEAMMGEPPAGKFRCPGCSLFQLNEARFCGECGTKISICATCKKPQVTGQTCKNCEQEKRQKEKIELDRREKERKDREEREKKEKLEREKREKKEKEDQDKAKAAEKEKKDREAKAEKERKEKADKEKAASAPKLVHKVEPEAKSPSAESKKDDTIQARTLGSLASMWDSKVAKADDELKNNVFSSHYDAAAAKKLKPGDKGYGSAPEGSESAVRAQKANDWVKVQVKQLIDVIKEIGTTGPGGLKQTNFGALFVRYETISDTVVGILQRAKKYGVVTFEGEMLFQGQSDGVVISLTSTADAYGKS